ncbi:phosphodiester glycosidase family protein [bacterium]|nr:phosphodiester glycosidase family protein [bacterium]
MKSKSEGLKPFTNGAPPANSNSLLSLSASCGLALSLILVSTIAPAALAQRDSSKLLAGKQRLAASNLIAMAVPHVSGHRAGSSLTSLASRRVSGQRRHKFDNSEGRRLKTKVHTGAYTKLTWMKAKPLAKSASKPALKPASPKTVVSSGSGLSPSLAASSVRNIGPGVLYKVYGGRTRINLLDVNMSVSPVQVRPMPASSTFHALKDVHDHVRDSGALAAINANYFKGNGTPLGTLMLDGEWLSGPLYTRVALGFTDGGYARIARVAMHGILHTSILGHETLWVNNMNQPRSSGSHCVLYTRRWGESVSLPYEGTLIAVNSFGEIVDSDSKHIAIPFGGFVLADSKDSPLAALRQNNGAKVSVDWSITPKEWTNVTQAVSGGPLLLKDGKFAFDLKAEKFPASWTGSHITRRTAVGITADDHLLMATFEGPHSLYDVAKFFLKHGCTEAMNLDGGGSTTMVVNGNTVTRNANDSQRRVAVALGLFSAEKAQGVANANSFGGYTGSNYRPQADIASMLPAYHSEKALHPTAQSTQEALEQIKAFVPVAHSSLADAPDLAVSNLANSILRSPLPTESIAEERSDSSKVSEGSEQTITLGQLAAPASAAPHKNIDQEPSPVQSRQQDSHGAINQTVPKTTKSAKLKIDFATRLFKGFRR